jgi:hypothetical protein
MILAMHQPNLLPWIGYFHKMAQSDVFVLLDAVQVPRGRSYATRTKIKTPDGAKWLTMPTKHRGKWAYNEQPLMPIDKWLPTFWSTLRHNYARAKHWDYGSFYEVFSDAVYSSWTLAELNTRLILWAKDILEIKTEMVRQSEMPGRPSRALAPIYYCKFCECDTFRYDTYLSGNGARNYNAQPIFDMFNINLLYQEFQCPTYSQLWKTFQPNLSILDLIFNLGPTAKEIVHS